MKTAVFSFYSDKNTFTIDKLKFIKPTKNYNRPRSGLWLAKNNTWKDFVINDFDDSMVYKKQITYKYKVKIDMTDIFILTIENFINFFKEYTANHYDEINWNKFVKMNPTIKGIYLNFYPTLLYYKYVRLAPFKLSKFNYVKNFILRWMIPSLCIWDKSAILDFKLIVKNKKHYSK